MTTDPHPDDRPSVADDLVSGIKELADALDAADGDIDRLGDRFRVHRPGRPRKDPPGPERRGK